MAEPTETTAERERDEAVALLARLVKWAEEGMNYGATADDLAALESAYALVGAYEKAPAFRPGRIRVETPRVTFGEAAV